MPLILERNNVLEIFEEAKEKKWALPTFNSENLTTTEGILSAVKEFGKGTGLDNLPIIIGITNKYSDRPQSSFYTHTRNWEVGLKLFLKDLEILCSEPSPYSKLRVLLHLDHIQWDIDSDLLNWDMKMFSSIMYDASTLTMKDNISRTSEFVDKNKNKILIEGACDEIKAAGEKSSKDFSSPETAEEYYRATGVDIIVPNLGTEHRSSSSSLKYNSELARSISAKIGKRLCLHGSSSVSKNEISSLFDDGICKVNIWTALERDSAPDLLSEMLKNASKITGPEIANNLLSEKLIGSNAGLNEKASLDYFTNTYRQDIIFNSISKIVNQYLQLLYI